MADIPEDRVAPHPQFDEWTPAEIIVHKKKLEDRISEGSRNGTDKFLITWWLNERKLAEAELRHRNGKPPGPTKQEEFWPVPLSAKELLELPPDPTRWVWDQVLPVRATSALVAKAYTGKSTFAASLALAVARGIDFLGRPTQQGVVLYVYLDGPFDELRENLQAIGMGPTDQILAYAGRKPVRVVDWVCEQCVKNQVRLLIIDTAQKFFGFKEDKYEEKINKMQPMLDLADQHGFHALFTYHAAKKSAETISALGSVAAEANARVSLYLRRLGDTDQRIFDTEQNSGKKFQAIGISSPKDGFIRRVGTLQEVQIEVVKPKIIDFLIQNMDGPTQKEIKANLPYRGEWISKALDQLKKSGAVEWTGKGVAGNPHRHYLPGNLVKQEQPSAKIIDLFGNKNRE